MTKNNVKDTKQQLARLAKQKSCLEEELSALGTVLTSLGVRMDTPLVTPDGFPRADLDIVQIKTTRGRIACLKNDLQQVTDQIERGLHEYYASTREEAVLPSPNPLNSLICGNQSSNLTQEASLLDISKATELAFARVNSVSPRSPAEFGGLQPRDRLLRFGHITWNTPDRLSKVAALVKDNEGRPVEVIVSRLSEEEDLQERLSLVIVPRSNWGGNGLLGCHLLEA